MPSKFSEDRRQKILKALRDLADQSTLREMNGRQVADIVPVYSGRRRWSLNRTVAVKLNIPMGTVGQYIALLVTQKLVRPGAGPQRIRRWVVMKDD